MSLPARILSFLVLALVPCLLALPLGITPARAAMGPRAAGAGATITNVEAGYEFGGGGNFRLSGPSTLHMGDVLVPVHVALRNDGDTVDGRLVISIDASQNGDGPSYRTDYTLGVTLPSGARKAVTLYLRAADVGTGFVVRLEVGGQAVDTRAVAPTVQESGALSVGVLSDDTAARAALVPLKFDATPLSVAQFNDRTPLDTQPRALDNFDLIVLTNYSSDTLSDAQIAALRAWVQGGGTLLVAGGPDAQKTLSHLPPDLLPVVARSVATAPALPELARLAGAAAPQQGPIEYSVAAPGAGATVLLAHHGVPLAAERPLGRGYVVYSAVEPTEAPLSAWPADVQGHFWNSLLAAGLLGPRDALIESAAQSPPSYASASTPLSALTNDLASISGGGLPALQVYVSLIVLYVLVLGPGNYLLLRWRRHLEWSWITIPVLATLFALGSFGLAYARNGGDVLANIDTVVYLDPGTAARAADSYIGLFAPFRGDYDLSTPAAALAWGLGNDSGVASAAPSPLGMSVDEGAQLTAHLAGMQMWTQRNVGVQRQILLPGQVTGNFVLKGSVISGEVINNTALTLHDCLVVGADGISALIPVLRPGQHARIAAFNPANANIAFNSGNNIGPLSTPYSGLAAGSVADARLFDHYDAILNAVFPNGSAATATTPLTLLGWSTTPLDPFYVNGAAPHRTDINLFVAPLTLASAPGRFALAPGALSVSALDTSVTQSAGGTGNGLTLNTGDYVDVQLALPAAGHHLHLDTLTLQANLNAGGSSLASNSAALYNWQTGRWDTKDVSSGTATVSHAAAYASADGRILLRVQATQGDITFNDVDQNLQIGATGSVA